VYAPLSAGARILHAQRDPAVGADNFRPIHVPDIQLAEPALAVLAEQFQHLGISSSRAGPDKRVHAESALFVPTVHSGG
jgi:hypothetical protein